MAPIGRAGATPASVDGRFVSDGCDGRFGITPASVDGMFEACGEGITPAETKILSATPGGISSIDRSVAMSIEAAARSNEMS